MIRRLFLCLPGYAAAGCTGTCEAWSAGHLRQLIRDQAAARALGKAYLQASPDLALTRAFLRQLPPLGGAGGGARLGKWVQMRIDHDFARGDTLVLSGWQVSHTEAAICGLFVL